MFVGNRNSNRPAARNPTSSVGFIPDLRVVGIMPESDAIRQSVARHSVSRITARSAVLPWAETQESSGNSGLGSEAGVLELG